MYLEAMTAVDAGLDAAGYNFRVGLLLVLALGADNYEHHSDKNGKMNL